MGDSRFTLGDQVRIRTTNITESLGVAGQTGMVYGYTTPSLTGVDEALRQLQPRFNKVYAKTGRPSIAPEKLLRALLLQALYSVRSARMLMEQLDYNLLFRWFVGLNLDDAIWDVTVFTKNRERLLDGDFAERFFQAVLQQARERSLLSDEHFTVDGTLLEAWASAKSYQRKDGQNAVPPDDPMNHSNKDGKHVGGE